MRLLQSKTWDVVVVEDDEAVAAVSCRVVSRQPRFRVVGRAATYPEAVSLIATTKPDLVLLDLGLPGRNGVELLRLIRGEGSGIEAIVVTAHSTPGIVRVCMQLGAVDYLVKPFWPERLEAALEAFADRAASLEGQRALDQETVDRVRRGAAPAGTARGIKRERLDEIGRLLESKQEMTAEEVAQEIGMARVTARRYLEQLVALGRCTVESIPEGSGRPRKTYARRPPASVGRGRSKSPSLST